MLEFNTNRPYSATGQIIKAKQLPNGGVMFYDITRGICGIIANCKLMRNDILANYDSGNYNAESTYRF